MLNRIIKFKNFVGFEVMVLLLISILLGLILFLTELSFIYVIQGFFYSINLLTADKLNLPQWFPLEGVVPIYLLLVFGVLRGLLYMSKQFLGGVISQSFIQKQRHSLVTYSLYNADLLETGEVVNIYSERVPTAGWVVQSFAQVIMMATSAFFLFVTGMKIAPKEMLISIFLVAFFIYPLRRFNKAIGESGDLQRKESDLALKNYIIALKHNFLIKIYDILNEKVHEIETSLDNYRNYYQKYSLISVLRTYSPNIVGILVLCFVTIYSRKTSNSLSAIEYISFFYLFIRFAQSVSDLNGNFSELRLNFGAFLQVYAWHNSHVEHQNERAASLLQQDHGEVQSVEAKDLSFNYKSGKILFKGISFKVHKGEVLTIKGRSGVGKSTLLKLITGIELPSEGIIKVNNVILGNLEFNLRKTIGYVGPEPFIIHGSIKENLLFGQKKIEFTNEEFNNVLKLVHLDQEVVDLNHKITDLSGLSTGQKQRLSLARSLLRRPQVLILDEATANLDIETENKIIEDLKKLSSDFIMIIVTHKSTFDNISTKIINL